MTLLVNFVSMSVHLRSAKEGPSTMRRTCSFTSSKGGVLSRSSTRQLVRTDFPNRVIYRAHRRFIGLCWLFWYPANLLNLIIGPPCPIDYPGYKRTIHYRPLRHPISPFDILY